MPWIYALIAGVCGISIIFYLYPAAGIAISMIFLAAVFLVPLLAALISAPQNERWQEARLFSQVMQVAESANESVVFDFKAGLIKDLEIAQCAIAKSQDKSAKRSGYASELHFFLLGSATLTALYFAAQGFINGEISGINVAVISLLPLVIFESIGALPSTFSQLSRIIEAIQNLDPYLSQQIKDSNTPRSKSLAQKVTIDFLQVNPVIQDANCAPLTAKVSPGETLIIMGKSGSGKSSLINSLLGFIPFTGRIEINGEDLATKHESLFSVLLQDDYLFATSIRENIKIGNPEAGDCEIEQMLEIVELADLVHDLPRGLDTHIGPLGYNFSGGEKQRMKLARLLLRNTPVFILDEPFEFLDANQAARIANKVSRILAAKTVIIISHQELNIPAKVLTLSS